MAPVHFGESQTLVFHPHAFRFVVFMSRHRPRNWGKGRSRAAAKRRRVREALLAGEWLGR